MKMHPVGDEMFLTEEQRDVMKLKVVFCNFANVPKIKNT